MQPQMPPRRSRKPVFIFIVIAIVILGTVGYYLLTISNMVPEGTTGTQATDCGSDRDCFLTALDTCSHVKASLERTHYNVTLLWEITGGTPGACTVDVTVTAASNPLYPDKGVTCTMSRGSQLNFFQGGGDTCDACSGSLMQATGVCAPVPSGA
jgi:hypothetical protein